MGTKNPRLDPTPFSIITPKMKINTLPFCLSFFWFCDVRDTIKEASLFIDHRMCTCTFLLWCNSGIPLYVPPRTVMYKAVICHVHFACTSEVLNADWRKAKWSLIDRGPMYLMSADVLPIWVYLAISLRCNMSKLCQIRLHELHVSSN